MPRDPDSCPSHIFSSSDSSSLFRSDCSIHPFLETLTYRLKLQILSASLLLAPYKRSLWTGFSLVPCAFCVIISSPPYLIFPPTSIARLARGLTVAPTIEAKAAADVNCKKSFREVVVCAAAAFPAGFLWPLNAFACCNKRKVAIE